MFAMVASLVAACSQLIYFMNMQKTFHSMKKNYEKRMRQALGELNLYNPHGLRQSQKNESENKKK